MLKICLDLLLLLTYIKQGHNLCKVTQRFLNISCIAEPDSAQLPFPASQKKKKKDHQRSEGWVELR